jgi:hypothetical protein
MVYDYTSNTPRTFIEEEGRLVDTRVAEALNRGRAVLLTTDENGHAIPIFYKH